MFSCDSREFVGQYSRIYVDCFLSFCQSLSFTVLSPEAFGSVDAGLSLKSIQSAFEQVVGYRSVRLFHFFPIMSIMSGSSILKNGCRALSCGFEFLSSAMD